MTTAKRYEMTTTPDTEYRTASGRVYVIDRGISGNAWATYERKENGALHRLVSPKMPVCETRHEAMTNFIRWVSKHVRFGPRATRDEWRPVFETILKRGAV